MEEKIKPYLIQFPKIGNPQIGFISIAENQNLPFIPKRIYWTYFTPHRVERGQHAHFELEQVLVAVAGQIHLTIETASGSTHTFNLNSPEVGVYIPKMCWRRMQYTHNAVQMCISNMAYDESDYIRSYDEFKKLSQTMVAK